MPTHCILPFFVGSHLRKCYKNSSKQRKLYNSTVKGLKQKAQPKPPPPVSSIHDHQLRGSTRAKNIASENARKLKEQESEKRKRTQSKKRKRTSSYKRKRKKSKKTSPVKEKMCGPKQLRMSRAKLYWSKIVKSKKEDLGMVSVRFTLREDEDDRDSLQDDGDSAAGALGQQWHDMCEDMLSNNDGIITLRLFMHAHVPTHAHGGNSSIACPRAHTCPHGCRFVCHGVVIDDELFALGILNSPRLQCGFELNKF